MTLFSTFPKISGSLNNVSCFNFQKFFFSSVVHIDLNNWKKILSTFWANAWPCFYPNIRQSLQIPISSITKRIQTKFIYLFSVISKFLLILQLIFSLKKVKSIEAPFWIPFCWYLYDFLVMRGNIPLKGIKLKI